MPIDLINQVLSKGIDLQKSEEIPIGLFRHRVPKFREIIIREILVNAVAHRDYSTSQDITLELRPDNLSVISPGRLPLGVTPKNILHAKNRRNPHLLDTLCAVGLMEAEGSGYDLMYQLLAVDGKGFPLVSEIGNSLQVTISAVIVEKEAVRVFSYFERNGISIAQKQIIALSIIVKERRILSTQLALELQLDKQPEARLDTWVNPLIELGVIRVKGNKRGRVFEIHPEVESALQLDLPPTLRTLGVPAIKNLILQVLSRSKSPVSSKTILEKLDGVLLRDFHIALKELITAEKIIPLGANRNRTYALKR